jgi:hypothetical protein
LIVDDGNNGRGYDTIIDGKVQVPLVQDYLAHQRILIIICWQEKTDGEDKKHLEAD